MQGMPIWLVDWLVKETVDNIFHCSQAGLGYPMVHPFVFVVTVIVINHD